MRAAQSSPLGSHAARALLSPRNPLVGEIHASRVSPQVKEGEHSFQVSFSTARLKSETGGYIDASLLEDSFVSDIHSNHQQELPLKEIAKTLRTTGTTTRVAIDRPRT
jgi:hypothetical protein